MTWNEIRPRGAARSARLPVTPANTFAKHLPIHGLRQCEMHWLFKFSLKCGAFQVPACAGKYPTCEESENRGAIWRNANPTPRLPITIGVTVYYGKQRNLQSGKVPLGESISAAWGFIGHLTMPESVIRYIASSFNGSTVAMAKWERHVFIWDLPTRSLISDFVTTFGFGLAITADGRDCIVGASRVHGIAAYNSKNGQEVWRRNDLKKTVSIRVSRDDTHVFYVPFKDRSYHVLSRATGL